jgi:hypothetical protein
MNGINNSILIKDKNGQFKTVDLGLEEKDEFKKDDLGFEKKESEDKEVNIDKTVKESLDDSKNEPVIDGEQKKENKEIKEEKIIENISKGAPAFYFDLEDEEEVSKFKKEDLQKNKQNNIEEARRQAKNILVKSGVKVELGLKMRLERIIETNLRGIRGKIETRESLLRKKEMGGIGLNEDQVDKILEAIKGGGGTLNNEPVQETQETKETQEHSVDNKIELTTNNEKEIKNNLQLKDNIQQATEKNQQKKEKDLKKEESVLKENKKVEDKKPEVLERKKPVGPVEELEFINFNDFRSFGETPEKRMQKIKDKIDLLQEESFEKRAEGIGAWRKSLVYKNYMQLGRESIEQGKSVQEIIQEKENNQEQVLSFEEFEALADLNEELSY